MKYCLFALCLMVSLSSAQALAPPNLGSPSSTVESFLKAMRVFDGEAVWAVMSQELRNKLAEEFGEMKKDERMDEFIKEFKAPNLRECRDAHEFLVSLFKAVRQTYPEKCDSFAGKLTDEKIRNFLDTGHLQQDGNQVFIKMEGLGTVGVVKEGVLWKVGNLDDFEFLDF